MEMATTYPENKRKYNDEYTQKTYQRIPLNVRKEYYREVISRIPEVTGSSVQGFIKEAIKEKIERDGLDLPDMKA